MPIRKKQQDRLWQFFADNPDEELTMHDIAAKLNCSLGAAYMTAARAAKLAHVEYAHVVRITEKGRRALAGGA